MLKKVFITVISLFSLMIPVKADDPNKVISCRKFEEGLYLYTALNDKKGIAHYIDSLHSCGNDNPSMLLALGRYLYNQDDYNGSDVALNRLIADKSSSPEQLGEAYYYLGSNAYSRKNYQLAIEQLLKATNYNF